MKVDADEATGWKVSTVFLGMDHNFRAVGPPILFESLVFAPGKPTQSAAFIEEWDGFMDRYATWEQAREGHERLRRELASALLVDQNAGGAMTSPH